MSQSNPRYSMEDSLEDTYRPDPMEDSYRQRVDWSENVAPKYPVAAGEGIEVVPGESPLYPMPPAHTHQPTYAHEQPAAHDYQPAPAPLPSAGGGGGGGGVGVVGVGVGGEKWTPTSPGWTEAPFSTIGGTEDQQTERDYQRRRRILGLTVPMFWLVILLIIVILAAGIGGGVGGGLKAQQQSVSAAAASSDTPQSSSQAPASSSSSSSSSSTSTATPTSAQSTSTSAPLSGPLPSDSGCPEIEGQTYTPYAVDGQAIPLVQGSSTGQAFRQHCNTRYATLGSSRTHDILRIFMPTLENCMMACAEYNQAYRANINNGTGVGGGYCLGVTIEKFNAGFCYLKNATTTNDTLGHPDMYSSGVLLTDVH
ncbi:hypothetical protein GGR54DRAFT_120408 [Hypoxylon sp. NC1633]|nr:hypothetical protein GGR54DRAFT_120408 [Hypoxylon sp. NC1633]